MKPNSSAAKVCEGFDKGTQTFLSPSKPFLVSHCLPTECCYARVSLWRKSWIGESKICMATPSSSRKIPLATYVQRILLSLVSSTPPGPGFLFLAGVIAAWAKVRSNSSTGMLRLNCSTVGINAKNSGSAVGFVMSDKWIWGLAPALVHPRALNAPALASTKKEFPMWTVAIAYMALGQATVPQDFDFWSYEAWLRASKCHRSGRALNLEVTVKLVRLASNCMCAPKSRVAVTSVSWVSRICCLPWAEHAHL